MDDPESERHETPPLRVLVTRPQPGTIRLALRGELDLLTVRVLCDAMTLVPPGAHVVIDLEQLTFLGSSGVNAIVEADRAARAAGSTLAVAVTPANRTVTRVLAIVGLDQLLTVHRGSAQQ